MVPGSRQFLLNAMSDGVLALGVDTRVRYANATACRLLGYERPQLEGRPLAELLAASVSTEFAPDALFDPVLLHGELIATDTVRLRHADGIQSSRN